MNAVAWEPESTKQYNQLRDYARQVGRELDVRDWEDSFHDALLYLIHQTDNQPHSVFYVKLIITDKMLNALCTFWHLRMVQPADITIAA